MIYCEMTIGNDCYFRAVTYYDVVLGVIAFHGQVEAISVLLPTNNLFHTLMVNLGVLSMAVLAIDRPHKHHLNLG